MPVGQPGEGSPGEVVVLAAGACLSMGSLFSPEVAASCPAPARASPGRGRRPEEDHADSLVDKIGSRPEEQQGKSPGVSRDSASCWRGGGLGWGRCCDQSRTGHQSLLPISTTTSRKKHPRARACTVSSRGQMLAGITENELGPPRSRAPGELLGWSWAATAWGGGVQRRCQFYKALSFGLRWVN